MNWVVNAAAVLIASCCVLGVGCRRGHEAANEAQPHSSEPPKPTPSAVSGPHPVLKTWKGRVDAVSMNIGIVWFSPRAPIDSRAVDAEAKQVLEENAAFLVPPPVLDAVIIKATLSAGGEGLQLSRTASYVFAKNSKGAWEYTEKYDAQFAKAHL